MNIRFSGFGQQFFWSTSYVCAVSILQKLFHQRTAKLLTLIKNKSAISTKVLETDYKKKNDTGNLKISFKNKNNTFEYQINENTLDIISEDNNKILSYKIVLVGVLKLIKNSWIIRVLKISEPFENKISGSVVSGTLKISKTILDYSRVYTYLLHN